MASIRAFLSGQSGKFNEVYGLTLEKAKAEASDLMAREVPPFVTPTGMESTFLYEKIEVYDDDGKYVTTAWGE